MNVNARKQWGVMYTDGSVGFGHFNGRTEEQRVRAEFEEVRAKYSGDNIRLVWRYRPNGQWQPGA